MGLTRFLANEAMFTLPMSLILPVFLQVSLSCSWLKGIVVICLQANGGQKPDLNQKPSQLIKASGSGSFNRQP